MNNNQTTVESNNVILRKSTNKLETVPTPTGAEKLVFGYPDQIKSAGNKKFMQIVTDLNDGQFLYKTTMKELLQAVENRQITGYINNRGGGNFRLDIQRCKNMAKEFKKNDLNMIIMADHGNDRYVLAVGHHRIGASLELKEEGNFEEFENQPVIVKVVPKNELVGSYAVDGRASTHKLKGKLANTDMGFAYKLALLLMRTEGTAPIRGIKLIDSRFFASLAKMTYAVSAAENAQSLTYQEMLSFSGGKIQALADLTKDEFKMRTSRQLEDKLIKAINYAVEVLAHAVKLTDLNNGVGKRASLSTIGKRITDNASLFSFLVWDHFTGTNQIAAVEAKTVAQKLVNKASLSTTALSMLSTKSTGQAIDMFVQIVRTNQTSIKLQ